MASTTGYPERPGESTSSSPERVATAAAFVESYGRTEQPRWRTTATASAASENVRATSTAGPGRSAGWPGARTSQLTTVATTSATLAAAGPSSQRSTRSSPSTSTAGAAAPNASRSAAEMRSAASGRSILVGRERKKTLGATTSEATPVPSSAMRRVDAVVVDLGGVLIDWDPRHLYRQVFDDEDAME